MKSDMQVVCRNCGKIVTLIVDMDDIAKWQDGELIQNVLPYLDSEEWELLISGTCNQCWGDLFRGET